jgi:hypothetical protein
VPHAHPLPARIASLSDRLLRQAGRRRTQTRGLGYGCASAEVALWVPPGCWKQGAVDQVRQLPDGLAIVGFTRIPHVLGAIATLLSKHPSEPHYYLPFMGVDLSPRGQGTGSAVLQPVLQW